MRAIHSQAPVRRMHLQADMDALSLVIRILCWVAGLGAAGAIYNWMLDVLGDPIPSAIITLILTMAVLVTTSGGRRR